MYEVKQIHCIMLSGCESGVQIGRNIQQHIKHCYCTKYPYMAHNINKGIYFETNKQIMKWFHLTKVSNVLYAVVCSLCYRHHNANAKTKMNFKPLINFDSVVSNRTGNQTQPLNINTSVDNTLERLYLIYSNLAPRLCY